MSKRTIIITGGNAGLGLAYARELGRDANTLVAIACRDLLRGERAATALGQQGVQARVLPLDLADLASVRHFPDVLREAALPPLAGLICNAGVQDGGTSRRTVDGFEETFGVNHLGHYLLARLLLPMMTCNASVVFVASNTHDGSTGTGLPEPSYPGALALRPIGPPEARRGRSGTPNPSCAISTRPMSWPGAWRHARTHVTARSASTLSIPASSRAPAWPAAIQRRCASRGPMFCRC